MSRNWTAEEYREFLRTGREPAGIDIGKAKKAGTVPDAITGVTGLGEIVGEALRKSTVGGGPGEKSRKYRNEPTEADGIRFDSRHEANVYLWLKGRKERGELRWIFRQVPFQFRSGITYRADFMTVLPDGTVEAVWDAKSEITAKNKEYVMKKKLLKSEWGIEIREVMARDADGRGGFWNEKWKNGGADGV